MVTIGRQSFTWFLCLSLAISSAGIAQEPQRSSPETTDPQEPKSVEKVVLLAIPTDTEYQVVLRKLEELFPKDFENARTKPRYKKQLAEKLMKLTPGTQNTTERFVMLSESLTMLEAEAPELPSSVPLLLNCANSLAAEFVVNPSKMKSDSLQKISSDSKTTVASIRQISKFIVPAIQEAVDRDDYSSARSLLQTGELISGRLIDSRFKSELDRILNEVDALELQYKAFLDAESLLITDTENKEAHQRVGLYLGLRKGMWQEASRHAQWIDDAEVQSLVVGSTVENRTVAESASLADSWWDWAARQSTIESKQAKSLAANLYSGTVSKLTGLSKIVAEERRSFNETLPLVYTRNPVAAAIAPETMAEQSEQVGPEPGSAEMALAPRNVPDDDEIGKRLEKAKEKYRAVVIATKKPVMIQIDRSEARSRQVDSPAKVQSVVWERERFEKFGVLPSFCDASLLKQRMTSHEKIVEAFRLAIRDYTRNKQDAEATAAQAEMEIVWPGFLDQPEVGGWNLVGDGRMEISDGLLAISGRGPRSGIISTNQFPPNRTLKINLCASENVKAAIGIRVHMGKDQQVGYTSSITGNGEAISVGKIGLEGDAREVGENYSVRSPNQFFELRFGFDQFGAATVAVDGRHSVGMGPINQSPARIGIFVTEGTLIVRSIEVTDPQ